MTDKRMIAQSTLNFCFAWQQYKKSTKHKPQKFKHNRFSTAIIWMTKFAEHMDKLPAQETPLRKHDATLGTFSCEILSAELLAADIPNAN